MFVNDVNYPIYTKTKVEIIEFVADSYITRRLDSLVTKYN
jgi:hypothetical protein